MLNSFSSSMYLPYTLFETVGCFDDIDAGDMQCGDMVEQELISLGLKDVSAKVDPYRLIRYDYPKSDSIDGFFDYTPRRSNITHQQCVDILFKEMKELSKMFSFLGEYKSVIVELIDHFRYGNGTEFYSEKLNSAYHQRINGYSSYNPLLIIKNSFEEEIRLRNSINFSFEFFNKIYSMLSDTRLPKFNDKIDRVNGMGISVHDIAAQKITLLDFQQYTSGWSATLHFSAQDHFGLDVADIKNKLYSQFRFFRIWFFLQRHRDFAFKPFFTHFDSIQRVEVY